MFGKAAVMLLLAAGAMYGSMAMVMQPKMLRSIVENTRETVRMKFTELKSFVKIFTIQNVDSMALYCEEFVSSPALRSLKEAVQGCDMKQLHDMAKMVREASKKVGRARKEDDLTAAVESWRKTGSITKAVVDWIKLKIQS